MICSRCNKEKPEIEFICNNTVYKVCNKCREVRAERYNRRKEGILNDKEVLSLRREDAVKRGNFVCCECGEEKPLNNFVPDKTGRSKFGKIGFCNQCRSMREKFSKIKRYYGISREEFLEVLEEQNGKCAICDIDMETFSFENNKANTLCIDHCHTTGKFRGLICNNCNRAIGLMKDNENILLSAYKYIVHFKSGELLEKPVEVNQQPSQT